MRHPAKLAIVLFFVSATVIVFLNDASSRLSSAQTTSRPTPTPPASNTNTSRTNTNTVTNTAPVTAASPATGGTDKKIPKSFTLGKDSQTEHGEVPFDHDTHAFKPYSPDGKSVIGCVECHHTDQPKSALKAPLVTSERDVILTMDVWKTSSTKVKGCRECHFQTNNIPDGSTMPTATYTERGKQVTKDLNNELAYHINCNTCHDAAAKLRPELKGRAGFATTSDCMTCHRPN
jgi:Zn ribbon nucleic-acid-binding protein